MKLPAALCLILIAACGGAGDDDDQMPATDAPDPMVDAAVDAPPEPMPAFVVFTVYGELAIDDNGIRTDYRLNGVPKTSSLTISLRDPTTPGSDYCEVVVPPTFLGFANRSTSNRQFKVVQLDLGAGPILSDGCGWDDAHMLQRLATMSPAEVGWMRARFAEDRPRLDIYYGGEWLPPDTASIVHAPGLVAYAMAPDGTATTTNVVEPDPGTLLPGVYQY